MITNDFIYNIFNLCLVPLNNTMTDSNTVITLRTHLEFYSSSNDPVLHDLRFNTYVPQVLSMALASRLSLLYLALALTLALAHLHIIQYSSAFDHVSFFLL